MGDQIKQAFQKLKTFWSTRTPKIKKLLITGLTGLLVIAVALTVFINVKADRFTVLFANMEPEEATKVYKVVQELGYNVRMDDRNQVFVPTALVDDITMQLAMQYYPKTTLPYDIFDGANGLTSTDFEKRQVLGHQLQNRLQDTINRLAGVENNVVTLSLGADNQKVWETTSAKSTASVTVQLEQGVKLTPKQVSGIKWLVASAVEKMEVTDVQVIDAATSIKLKSTEDQDPDSLTGMLERLNLEERIEQKYTEKVLNLLTMVFDPQKDAIRVSCTVKLDYSKMIRESKVYQPSEQSTDNSGVVTHRDNQATTQGTPPAQGIPGEEDNTDVPPTYVDQLQGTGEFTDNSASTDYVVSYILDQVEKDQAELKSATIAVALKGEVDETTRASIIANVAKAVNVAEADISVENYIVEIPNVVVVPPYWWENLSPQMMALIGSVIAAFLLIVIIICVMIAGGRRRRRERALLETAQAEVMEIGDQDTEFNLQQELEERKRQLRESSAKTADEAIADEVRDFAKINPEITANLLRAWMKEEID